MIQNIQAILLAHHHEKPETPSRSLLAETVCGKELILYPLSLLSLLKISTSIVFAREHSSTSVQALVQHHYPSVHCYQESSPSTGTAQAALLSKSAWTHDDILILKADIPLLSSALLEEIITRHRTSNAVLTFTYAHHGDTSGAPYDLVVNREGTHEIIPFSSNQVTQERCCVDGGIYLVKKSFLETYIRAIEQNKQTAFYHLSDLVALAYRFQQPVVAVAAPFDQIRSVRTFQELWAVEHIKRSDLIKYWMSQGVRFAAAQAVHLDEDIQIGTGTFIGWGAHIMQGTRIGDNCFIGPFSVLQKSVIHNEVRIEPYSILKNTTIGAESVVGPFAHVQEETVIGSQCHIGNFVEIKRSSIGNQTKAKHLAYLGDAQLGTQVNIGAGTITCNYDGQKKHTTVIKDHAFIGTNTSLVAPVTIGENSFIGAGSVITKDVPPYALGIARAKQLNKKGYMRKPQQDENSNKRDDGRSSSFLFTKAVKLQTRSNKE